MPRRTNETSREPAARATPARRDRAADADRQDEERNRITDEGLGLSPGRAPSEGERRGSGLVEPADAVPDFEPMGQRTGPLGDAATPTGRAEVVDEESDLTTTPHTLDGADRANVDADVEPSLVDQPLLTDPIAAVGDPDDTADPAAAGDEVYVPPTDPVVGPGRHGDVTVLGGFSPSAGEEIRPRRSASDGQIGDEAIVDAVQSALLHDAATTELAIEVTVEQGIVYLRGTVAGPEDAENAEAVASRVEGRA
jgi:hypothetical protein